VSAVGQPDISPRPTVEVEVRTGPVDVEALRIVRQKLLELDHHLRTRSAYQGLAMLRSIKGYLVETVGEEVWNEAALL
jgi:hypothetical protein